MCKDYIEFHCAAIWILVNLQSRAKSLAVMLNNINALIESQSVTCMPFDRWKSKKDERVKKGTSINDRRHILLWSESLYYYFYVRILYEYVCKFIKCSVRARFGLALVWQYDLLLTWAQIFMAIKERISNKERKHVRVHMAADDRMVILPRAMTLIWWRFSAVSSETNPLLMVLVESYDEYWN